MSTPHSQGAWADFAEIYGARWLRERGRVPSPAWDEALEGCSTEQLKRAMEQVKAKHGTHPVTLADFQRICRAVYSQAVDAQALERWWASIIRREVERTGAMRLFDGAALWDFGRQLYPRWSGDSQVISGTLGNEARNVVARLALDFAARELAGEARNELERMSPHEVLAELRRVRHL
jgi:hypothetical protein